MNDAPEILPDHRLKALRLRMFCAHTASLTNKRRQGGLDHVRFLARLIKPEMPAPFTSTLPFDEGTETFGSEHLTDALPHRLTHHVTIPEMNGDSCRLGQSWARQAKAKS